MRRLSLFGSALGLILLGAGWIWMGLFLLLGEPGRRTVLMDPVCLLAAAPSMVIGAAPVALMLRRRKVAAALLVVGLAGVVLQFRLVLPDWAPIEMYIVLTLGVAAVAAPPVLTAATLVAWRQERHWLAFWVGLASAAACVWLLYVVDFWYNFD